MQQGGFGQILSFWLLLRSVTSSFIGNIVVSIHTAFFIQYNLRNLFTQTTHWKSFLMAQKFLFHRFLSINSTSTEHPSLLWKHLKHQKHLFKCIIISHMSSKKCRQAEQREIVEFKLKQVERIMLKIHLHGSLKKFLHSTLL